jgi:hypothetical protein
LRFHSLLRRRPSPAIVISSVALFLSLGGVGYAAITIPSNSVGTSALKNNAVSYKKIQPGAVGLVRANLGQLQERVSGTCSSNNAIASIDQSGKVACNSTLPGETGTTSNTTPVPTTATSPTTVASTTLAAGSSYLALADPTATVTAATGVTTDSRVNVTCTLTVGSNTQTRSLTLNTGTVGIPASGSIPLQLAGPSGTSSVACSSSLPTGQAIPTTAPTVSVTSALNAIQVSG